ALAAGARSAAPRVALSADREAPSAAAAATSASWSRFRPSGASLAADAEWPTEPMVGEAEPPPAALLEAAPPTVLGQHRNTYIVVTDGEDLILVDQHTA